MEQIYIPERDYKVLVRCFTYNQSKYIEETLNGFAIQQTSFPFVCLVMDDCSTDGEQEVIKQWMERECDMDKVEYVEIELSIIALVPHKTNGYCTFAFFFLKTNLYKKQSVKLQLVASWREHCIYEAFCEGDDYWTSSTKLREQVNFMDNNPDYGMCYTNCDVIYQENNKIITNLLTQHNRIAEYKNLEEYIINRGYVAPPTWLYRREFLPSQSQKVKSVDGTFVYFAYFLAHTKVKFINCSTAIYRVLEESACHSKSYEKEYLREKNLLSVQLSLCEQYELPKDVSRRCEIGHYRHNLKRFIIYDKMEDVRHARKLIENKTIQERILFVVSSSKAGRRLLRIVYNNLRKFK